MMVNNVTIEAGERQVMYGVEIVRVGLFTTINFRYHNLTVMWDGGKFVPGLLRIVRGAPVSAMMLG